MRLPTIFIIIALFGQTIFAQKNISQLTEKQKIEYLIKSIENLDGAQFLRNNEYHTPKEAGEHLRLKLSKAGSSIKTAKQFIDNIATKSSMSGKPYKIMLKGGKIVESKVFLYQKLNELNK
jgi:hypothetical protein